MTKNNSRGVLMFAHNNEEIDYVRMAVVNSLLIQHHMGLTSEQITIVTDSESYKASKESMGKLLDKACSEYIIIEKDEQFKKQNIRTYSDTTSIQKRLSFYNANRCDSYDISPYEETLIIDVDYLILSDALNSCWGHNNDLMLNYDYRDVMPIRKMDQVDRLHPYGITMYWATVVYFRKGQYANGFFEIVKHVKDNKDYYRQLYKWPGNLYRNDYSFSIAAHMMAGFKDAALPQLPVTLYKSFDSDDIYKVDDLNDMVLYLENTTSTGEFVLSRWKGVDIHIMNKWAINRVSEKFLELLNG